MPSIMITKAERRVREKLLKTRWARASKDPLVFLKHFAFTIDQHTDGDTDPVKPFPAEREHVQYIARLWQHNRRLVIAKSRQMIQTWEFAALALWDAMFHKGKLIFLQSKREEDAVGNETAGTGLLGRCKFILNHIPGGDMLVPEHVLLANKIEFPTLNSTLWAIPEGGNIIRTHTASGIFSDEAAFQDDFGHAYVAMLPCVRGGGWVVACSTPDPGFFELLYQDRLNEEI